MPWSGHGLTTHCGSSVLLCLDRSIKDELIEVCGMEITDPTVEPGRILNVRLIGIPVVDLDVAIEFYTVKLGFKVRRDFWITAGHRWVELQIGDSRSHFVLVRKAPDDRVGEAAALALKCDNLSATYNRLKEFGVVFTGPIEDRPWGYSALFQDPDGNALALVGPNLTTEK